MQFFDSDFIKGKFEGVSLARDGRLSLAPRLDTLFASEQPVIWSVVLDATTWPAARSNSNSPFESFDLRSDDLSVNGSDESADGIGNDQPDIRVRLNDQRHSLDGSSVGTFSAFGETSLNQGRRISESCHAAA